MSKNITIQEGGVGKQLTVDKLKTNLVGGGTCMWVPEEDVRLGQKTIDANGTYRASDDGFYGYSQVDVENVGIVIGKIPRNAPSADGNEYLVTSDGNSLEFQKIPSSIKVTSRPTITEYDEGDTIDYTGIVVTKYDANGQSMGTVPFQELILPKTEAEAECHEYWTDGSGVNTIMLSYVQSWYQDDRGRDRPIYVSEPIGSYSGEREDYEGMPVVFGNAGNDAGPTQFMITKYGNKAYCMGSTARQPLNQYVYNSDAESYQYRLIRGTSASTGDGPVVSCTWDFVDYATIVPVSTVEPTGTENMHPVSASQVIPVGWARTEDGKMLETSFKITVNDDQNEN